ncbi:Transcriptional regulatory protein YpdB [bioreactor metagenome]|uniref:Transcriptional regulatory protein YpdB n=1 Tax=bioreactor metagenome TaxID=1076179 RepID=A0A644YUW0_9ZZZZ
MFKIAICDDDNKVRDELKKHLEEYKGDNTAITSYCCGEDLLKEKRHFDLIFLDISMTGMDGIETARVIRAYDKNVKIIYLTSFTDYTNLAFEVHAFGYLHKPINREQIFKQLYEALAYRLEAEGENSIEFITSEGVVRLSPRDIYYFEYLNRRVIVKTTQVNYCIKEKITVIADTMAKYNFRAPHKSFVVNLLYVKAIKGYDIYLMDGSIVPLSQKKSTEFRENFNIFLSKHIQKNM